jgi:hypothetical protein
VRVAMRTSVESYLSFDRGRRNRRRRFDTTSCVVRSASECAGPSGLRPLSGTLSPSYSNRWRSHYRDAFGAAVLVKFALFNSARTTNDQLRAGLHFVFGFGLAVIVQLGRMRPVLFIRTATRSVLLACTAKLDGRRPTCSRSRLATTLGYCRASTIDAREKQNVRVRCSICGRRQSGWRFERWRAAQRGCALRWDLFVS